MGAHEAIASALVVLLALAALLPIALVSRGGGSSDGGYFGGIFFFGICFGCLFIDGLALGGELVPLEIGSALLALLFLRGA